MAFTAQQESTCSRKNIGGCWLLYINLPLGSRSYYIWPSDAQYGRLLGQREYQESSVMRAGTAFQKSMSAPVMTVWKSSSGIDPTRPPRKLLKLIFG
jgi:hypothetical protein